MPSANDNSPLLRCKNYENLLNAWIDLGECLTNLATETLHEFMQSLIDFADVWESISQELSEFDDIKLEAFEGILDLNKISLLHDITEEQKKLLATVYHTQLDNISKIQFKLTDEDPSISNLNATKTQIIFDEEIPSVGAYAARKRYLFNNACYFLNQLNELYQTDDNDVIDNPEPAVDSFIDNLYQTIEDQIAEVFARYYADNSFLIKWSENFIVELFMYEKNSHEIQTNPELLEKTSELKQFILQKYKNISTRPIELIHIIASKAVGIDNNAGELHNIITQQIRQIPGIALEQKKIQHSKNELRAAVKQLQQSSIYSQFTNHNESVSFVDTLDEKKVQELSPYYSDHAFLFTWSEDFIRDLCLYVIDHPEINSKHNSHDKIYDLMQFILMQNEQTWLPPVELLRKIAEKAADLDIGAGELHNIIARQITLIPGMQLAAQQATYSKEELSLAVKQFRESSIHFHFTNQSVYFCSVEAYEREIEKLNSTIQELQDENAKLEQSSFAAKNMQRTNQTRLYAIRNEISRLYKALEKEANAAQHDINEGNIKKNIKELEKQISDIEAHERLQNQAIIVNGERSAEIANQIQQCEEKIRLIRAQQEKIDPNARQQRLAALPTQVVEDHLKARESDFKPTGIWVRMKRFFNLILSAAQGKDLTRALVNEGFFQNNHFLRRDKLGEERVNQLQRLARSVGG